MVADSSSGRIDRFRGREAPKANEPWPLVEVIQAPVRLAARNWLFLLTVLIPTIASIIYFGAMASDVYISESRFVVRTPQRPQQPGVIGALLQGSGFQRSQDDAFTVQDFMTSRDALRALDSELGIKRAFSSESLDPLSRFPQPWADDSFESLYKYYVQQISVNHDAATSITTLKVRAYAPEDAFRINEMLLLLGEMLINRINDRGRVDLIRYAAADVAEAEAKAKAAAAAVANYRNKRRVFDPERQSTLQLQQVTKLQDELIGAKMQLAEVRALSPANPQIATLERRARDLEKRIEAEMAKVAGDSENSFTEKATDFERLQLERGFADRQVTSALANLESARSEARRKQLYLERIVLPNKPDDALEPRRLRSIFATLVVGLIMWGVLSMLVAGVREHRD